MPVVTAITHGKPLALDLAGAAALARSRVRRRGDNCVRHLTDSLLVQRDNWVWHPGDSLLVQRDSRLDDGSDWLEVMGEAAFYKGLEKVAKHEFQGQKTCSLFKTILIKSILPV